MSRNQLVTNERFERLPRIWKTKSGHKIKIGEMDNEHLLRAHRMMVMIVAREGKGIMDYFLKGTGYAEGYIEAFEKELKKRNIIPLVKLCDCFGGYQIPLDYQGEALDYLIGAECCKCKGRGWICIEKGGV